VVPVLARGIVGVQGTAIEPTQRLEHTSGSWCVCIFFFLLFLDSAGVEGFAGIEGTSGGRFEGASGVEGRDSTSLSIYTKPL